MLSVILFILLASVPVWAQAPEAGLSPADELWKKAQALLKARQYPKAQDQLSDFIIRHSSDARIPEARVCLGICDYRQGQTSDALAAWSRTVSMELMQKRASPALRLGLEQLSGHYRKEQNINEGKKVLGQLLSLFPGDPVTVREVSLFAQQRLEKGDPAEAVRVYERVEEHLSAADKDELLLARALSTAGGGVSALVKAANQKLEENQVPLAERLYKEALKRNPSATEKREATANLGWCLYLQNQHKEAETLWQEVIRQGPPGDEWVGQSRWRLILLNSGPYHKAEEAQKLCLVQAKEFDGKFKGEQALFTRAWLYWAQKKWEPCRLAFADLIRAYPEKGSQPTIQEYLKDCEKGLRR